MMAIGWSASDPSILPSWSKTAGSYDVLAWPDRARPEHPSNTVTQVAGLKCYQRRHLNRAEPLACLNELPDGVGVDGEGHASAYRGAACQGFGHVGGLLQCRLGWHRRFVGIDDRLDRKSVV